MNAQAVSGVGPIRWDVLPQQHKCTKEMVSAVFLSCEGEELRDIRDVVMLLFLLAGTGMILSEHDQGSPFLLQCAGERQHQYKRKVWSPFQVLS